MHWELWETESANLVETFDTEAEGLQAVREMLAVNKPDLVDSLVLGASFDEDEPRDVELPPVLDGEVLKARLAELAQEEVAEAAHKVHARIRKWLAEEGWHVRDIDDPQSSFNIMVALPDSPEVNIFQRCDHVDRLTLSEHWVYADDVRSIFGQLSNDNLQDVVWKIYRDVSLMGMDFAGLDTPSTEMTLRTYIYFDGLTKDVLVQRILLTIRSIMLAGRTFLHALEVQSRLAQRALSDEDRAKILHIVPRTESHLTAAS